MTERAFVIDKQLQRLLLSNDDEIIDGVTQAIEGTESLLLSMQAIVNAIIYPNSVQSKHTLSLVNASVKYVNWYKLILASYTSMHSAAQVAASSVQSNTLLIHRRGRGFTLKVTQEASSHKEVYLILTLEHVTSEQSQKGLFMHCAWQRQFYVIPFGVPTKNKVQAIVSTQDKVFNAIANTESHLYLT